ncbi:hypothetical protein KITKAT_57 [Arthrobacter phage Kitkat]|uniref:Uncharacterized protein n=2 Tax=Kelleziovirus kitkat TaxID=1982238 RepID=A0A140G6N3_9CAUD|nr:hypothetical protein BJD77_gp057 [Arthrobacter phage Kitkat]AMM44318.1 hypothetical protein KITKAT_57 [Arthrobacter phage Kitkat]QGJ96495.1 hypothetical protein SEA_BEATUSCOMEDENTI_56 [Arthrobacter phage BeatusComedenti]
MGKNSVTGGQPIKALREEYIGKVVANASGSGSVLNGVIIGINTEGVRYKVVTQTGAIEEYPFSQLVVLADSVTDHVAKATERIYDAHRAQLAGLAKDLNVLGREKDAEDEIRTVLTDNGVTPAPEVYRLRVEMSFFLDVRPQSVNAFDKVTETQTGKDWQDWLTNSIKLKVERDSHGEGANIYVEPDSDFSFEDLHLNVKAVTAVTELGE